MTNTAATNNDSALYKVYTVTKPPLKKHTRILIVDVGPVFVLAQRGREEEEEEDLRARENICIIFGIKLMGEIF